MMGIARRSSIERIGFGCFASWPAHAARKKRARLLVARLVMTVPQSIGAHHGLPQGAKVDELRWANGRGKALCLRFGSRSVPRHVSGVGGRRCPTRRTPFLPT